MITQHIILVLLWILFSLFHSVFASAKWKKKIHAVMNRNYKYYRFFYSVFACITLSIIIGYHFTIKSLMLWKTQMPETIIAVAGILTGGIIMIFFAKKFFFELSGADIFLKIKNPEILISTNFYKYVRHPLYAATLLFIWSIFLWQPMLNNLISCICITIYTVIGIHFEEKKLVKDFGDSYIQYRAKTPMFVPKFY